MTGRPRLANTIGVDVQELITDREEGLKVAEIAERHGLSVGQVNHLVKSEGCLEQWKAALPGRSGEPIPSVEKAVRAIMREHTELTIERGLTGGYVATIDDVPGEERRTLQHALHNARKAQAAKTPQKNSYPMQRNGDLKG
jgi:hypothetical protein